MVSIVLYKLSDTAAVHSMGVHRSRDCGKTWEGPFEVTAASNPNGQLFLRERSRRRMSR